MFNRIINSIAGNYNEKEIKKLLPLVNSINARCDEFDVLQEEELKVKTQELKDKIQQWDWSNFSDDLTIDAFALVKQACKRLVGASYTVKWEEKVRNMVPYDVQIIWWLTLHRGKISEMKTGEGKTLVATMPAFLNALTGKWVHIVTVNDYLASRDSDQMKILFEFLWLSVWCVTKATPLHLRREQYEKDITYIENSELGFDYLRDNLTKSMRERNLLRRPLYYAIVDEVDSILIDESRTPLIISEPDAEPTDKYSYYAQIVQMLIPSTKKKKVSKWFLHDMLQDNKKDSDEEESWDYYIDEKTKTVAISSTGIIKLEKILNVENLYRDLGYEEIHHIENALKANACYHEGKEYIIHSGEIVIVDENTGRAQQWRRFSQWLHQAIEAKEKVTIQKESETLATITYQNFFKQYKKLAGMTGTATTEGEEFDSIYNLHVLAIPTNKPVIRVDKNDKVYFNQPAKWKFVVDQITFAHQMGQPLLIGTSSIQTSEFVSSLLKRSNIIHSVLNAKFHEEEAQIISRAGRLWSVVVATNMAGRGTDIKLEEWLNEKIANNYSQWMLNHKFWVSATLYSEEEFELTINTLKNNFPDLTEEKILWSYTAEQSVDKYSLRIILNTKKKFAFETFAQIILKSTNDISLLEQRDVHYGLWIIGTEKHESRRIDNQLRGRAGRQWDPGMSVFYVALDDTIMRKMWGEKIQGVASMLLPQTELETLELTQSQFTNSIIRAQKQMEWWHFGIRKHLFDYDSVIDKQRQSIYTKRDIILQILDKQLTKEEGEKAPSENVVDSIISFIEPTIVNFLEIQQTLWTSQDWILELINKEFWLSLTKEHVNSSSYNTTAQHIAQHIIAKIADGKEILSEEQLTLLCSNIYLKSIDTNRVEHIDDMQYLREKVWLMWYAQLDPLVIYKKESYEKYQTLLQTIHYMTVVTLANIDFKQMAENIKNRQAQNPVIMLDWAEWNNNNEATLTETTEEATTQKSIDTIKNQISKNRPNDKVNVRYSDGKTLRDVKYKTVKDDIATKKCQII